jgi:hypothetical protein
MEFKEILVEFRALGGIANNIDCRQAKNGRGLFAVNPDLPIQLHCPPNLLIERQYIELDDQKHIQVSEKANANKHLKSFYEKLGYVVDFERHGYTQNSSCIFLKRSL